MILRRYTFDVLDLFIVLDIGRVMGVNRVKRLRGQEGERELTRRASDALVGG